MRLIDIQRLYESGGSLYEGNNLLKRFWLSPDGKIIDCKGDSHWHYAAIKLFPEMLSREEENGQFDPDRKVEFMDMADEDGFVDFVVVDNVLQLGEPTERLNQVQSKAIQQFALQHKLSIKR